MCSCNRCSVVYIRGVLDPFFVGFRHHRVINNAKANLRDIGGMWFCCCYAYHHALALDVVELGRGASKSSEDAKKTFVVSDVLMGNIRINILHGFN
jgi:hypothetical protein